MKKIIATALVALAASPVVFGQSWVNTPYASSASGSDTFRARDGASCTGTIMAPSITTGVAAGTTGGLGSSGSTKDTNGASANAKYNATGGTAFLVLNIPLTNNIKGRMDCNRLYEMELDKLQMEIQQLRDQAEQAKKDAIAAANKPKPPGPEALFAAPAASATPAAPKAEAKPLFGAPAKTAETTSASVPLDAILKETENTEAKADSAPQSAPKPKPVKK